METLFTDWLFFELNKREWSQSDLSIKSGISQGAISKVINGQRNPGIDFCEGIARAFNVPAENIYRLAGLLPLDKNGSEDREILYLFNQLSPGDKEDFLDLLRIKIERKRAVSKKKTALSV